jgi:2-aminoadipate transaminase
MRRHPLNASSDRRSVERTILIAAPIADSITGIDQGMIAGRPTFGRWLQLDLPQNDINVQSQYVQRPRFPTIDRSQKMTSRTAASHAMRSFDSLLSQRGRHIAEPRTRDPQASAKLISLIYGYPDADSLPASSVAESTSRVLEKDGRWALQYGATQGVAPLIAGLRAKLSRDNGIDASPEEILITAGGSQAVQLVLDLFVDWGDTVIVEAPTWMGFLWALKNVGGNAVAVPLDEHGMRLDALETTLQDLKRSGVTPKFIYVIPNFQNPSGVSMSVERRKRLIEQANEYETVIFEDDAYHDLRYGGDHLPSIYSLDDTGSTIHTATFSKIMGAGMRLGWLIAPSQIVQKLSVLKIDGSTNVFGAYVAADWIEHNLLDHVDQLKRIYANRRDAMLAALERYMPVGTTWTHPDGGFFVWVEAPESVDLAALAPHARELGLEYLPGATCFADGSGRNTARLSFSFATEEQIEDGVRILGDIIRGEMMEAAS